MRSISEEPLARVRRDRDSRTITLILDAAIANIAMFAIAAHANEREAHVREVEGIGRSLPEGSYGRSNRQSIAAHQTGVAARLRASSRPTAPPSTTIPPRYKLTGVRPWSGLC
jgi:hypothetical protein